jgi:hypothetical protein
VSDVAYGPLVHEVMALELRKIKSRIISFPDFFLSAYRYSFDIWYIAVPITKIQIKFEFGSIHRFFTKLWPLDLEIYHELSVFRTFPLSAYRYSFNIWYIVLPY